MRSTSTVPISKNSEITLQIESQFALNMASDSVKAQALSWANALWTGKEPFVSDLYRFVFGLSYSGDRLEKLGSGLDEKGENTEAKKDACLTLLTSSLLSNDLELLEGL